MRAVQGSVAGQQIARVVCLWEPGVILAAKLREALGVPGMGVDQAQTFRNKDLMKQKVTAAGMRTPQTCIGDNDAQESETPRRRSGFPLIIKPIAGAGSMDTIARQLHGGAGARARAASKRTTK